ncbi:MAG: 3-hydroxyacyl-CoA dehydrogenase NAD-binding domain-containing protein, partial [Pseudomonadota bacterium]
MSAIKTVGVVGAGQMGNGIAHVCALSGYDVWMSDISQAALDDGLSAIEHNLERQCAKEMISAADVASAR